MAQTTIAQMLAAGVHFGHQARYWNPKMSPFIYGERAKVQIINLDKTLTLYQKALGFMGQIAARKGKILFVGTKFCARKTVREEAIRCGMPYIDQRWLGGMLTNYKTIRQSIKRLKELETFLLKKKTLERMTKKEILNLQREKDKLEASIGGIKKMGGLPDAIFVIDATHERIAINEANKMRIPVIGIVDTNGDPKGIDYLIPGNDDAYKAIRLYFSGAADAILAAQANEGATTEEYDDEAKPKAKPAAKGAKTDIKAAQPKATVKAVESKAAKPKAATKTDDAQKLEGKPKAATKPKAAEKSTTAKAKAAEADETKTNK